MSEARRWAYYDAISDEMIEGGFFSQHACEVAMLAHATETKKSLYMRAMFDWE